MRELMARRVRPFGVVGALTLVVCIAVIRLPDTFIALLERNSPFTSSAQMGWAYRLLAFAAVGQILYGGFVLLRPERVDAARKKDPKLALASRSKITGIVARTAASMTLMTLVYGLASLGVTGQRGGFWLFPLLAVAQGAWYYHQVGQIAQWMGFQPEAATDETPRALWKREPEDYCPPLARGLLKPADADR
jgi:hypothetical protein